ncbi:hypothetical protein [Desulfovibrio sp.]|uniref:hypothetical protein n=1 Tax=Desulfovibrio sp. TaxID=885 RepID=UPI0025C6D816|nr:hypothetical protein [Desulfovibrio sp.]MCI7568616.1 hypothetical protein [Desulfovibrio sp.]
MPHLRPLVLAALLLIMTAMPTAATQHLTGEAFDGLRWGTPVTNLPPFLGTARKLIEPVVTDQNMYHYALSRAMSIADKPVLGYVSATETQRLNGLLFHYCGTRTFAVAMKAFRDMAYALSRQWGPYQNESLTGRHIYGHEHYRYRWRSVYTVITLTADFYNGIGEIFVEYLPVIY